MSAGTRPLIGVPPTLVVAVKGVLPIVTVTDASYGVAGTSNPFSGRSMVTG
ncbi:Uncharacterised protein [Mycobacterium tuberculosis]|nr:Uncharacterised protein [Mycobacterium tuberculosis]